MDERIGVQTILGRFLHDYQAHHQLSPRQQQVCRHIEQCHTPALGGLRLECDQCDYDAALYHGCRDRHCPQCQQRASQRWSEREQQSVLPVTYHHLVFTLPHTLNRWVQLHPEVIYRQLFHAVWGTLKTFGRDPKRLDGELGMTAVLHTWGQNLSQHVHLHCLIPGGVLRDDGSWRSATSTYLFPVRALSRHFRGRMVSALRRAYNGDQLHRIIYPGDVDTTLDQLMHTEWVVYSKPCLSRTETVVRYLAQYSHRIAIGDHRIVGINDNRVQFRYKDYRNGHSGVMNLDAEEFIRRYLLHVLPKGLMRIRHYGWLANCCRRKKLDILRAALAATEPAPIEPKTTDEQTPPPVPCPRCRQGLLRVCSRIEPKRRDCG